MNKPTHCVMPGYETLNLLLELSAHARCGLQ